MELKESNFVPGQIDTTFPAEICWRRFSKRAIAPPFFRKSKKPSQRSGILILPQAKYTRQIHLCVVPAASPLVNILINVAPSSLLEAKPAGPVAPSACLLQAKRWAKRPDLVALPFVLPLPQANLLQANRYTPSL